MRSSRRRHSPGRKAAALRARKIELVIDRTHVVGRGDRAGVADIVLEAALTTIADLEDSVAAVDGEDKTAAYANWLGLMREDLEARFDKGGRAMTRRLEEDRRWRDVRSGPELVRPGRSLLSVRNVGHLMTTPAVDLPDGSEGYQAPWTHSSRVSSACTISSARGRLVNSRAGSIYVVKPKMHGPNEAAYANVLFER